MRTRTSAHDQAVARRLEQLSAELARERPGADDGHTRVRPAGGSSAAAPLDPPLEPPLEPASPGPAPVPVPGRHARRRVRSAGWLPEAWVERTVLGPGPVAVVAVLSALGLALACWWLLRGQPEPVQIETTSVGALTTSLEPSGHPGASAAPPEAEEIVVDVAGRVRRPGIVVLTPGARVVDAIKGAGGARRGVDLAGLNLARPLSDGEQVLVGVTPAPGADPAGAASAPGGAGTTGGLLNLNSATSEQLQELPGVGPVTAEAILSFRSDHGPFSRVEELLDVRGIGPATLAEIAPRVTV